MTGAPDALVAAAADGILARWRLRTIEDLMSAAAAPLRIEFPRLLHPDERVAVEYHWPFWARPGQMPPAGAWRTWLILAGRGFGKTRAGAEWIRGVALAGDADTRIALVAATLADIRNVMIEGESGILRCSRSEERPAWEPSLGKLVWPNGAQGQVFSSETPDRLRGPQHHFAWCDELASWNDPKACWDNLQLGLRCGEMPRALITTTPRAIPLLRILRAQSDVAITRGRMIDNDVLPDSFRATMTDAHEGTRYGRQELDGELIDDVEGALWTRGDIEGCRVRKAPALRRVVVGVDPPASAGGDACGIVVVGLGEDGLGYVIADASVAGRSPEGWAAAVADAAGAHGADRVVAEANNGGEMVESVLRAADAGLPVKRVHASHGKVVRAEPVAALYARGRVKHAGAFPALEDELCGLVVGGGYEGPGRSPDRADACVWAVTELMLGKRRTEPRVIVP